MLAERSRPAFAGAYPVAEASLYIRATMQDLVPKKPLQRRALESINTRHLYHWVKQGLAGRYLLGFGGRDVTLNFFDLISLRLITAMRSHGVSSHDIQVAHDELQMKWQVSHPFAMEQLWISGRDVFVKEGLSYLAVSKRWQFAFDFIEQYLVPLHGITFSLHDHLPLRWTPSPQVILDPAIQFGDPCIQGTRVATEVIWSFNRAGDSKQELSRMYGLPLAQIEAAIDWERKLATARN